MTQSEPTAFMQVENPQVKARFCVQMLKTLIAEHCPFDTMLLPLQVLLEQFEFTYAHSVILRERNTQQLDSIIENVKSKMINEFSVNGMKDDLLKSKISALLENVETSLHRPVLEKIAYDVANGYYIPGSPNTARNQQPIVASPAIIPSPVQISSTESSDTPKRKSPVNTQQAPVKPKSPPKRLITPPKPVITIKDSADRGRKRKHSDIDMDLVDDLSQELNRQWAQRAASPPILQTKKRAVEPKKNPLVMKKRVEVESESYIEDDIECSSSDEESAPVTILFKPIAGLVPSYNSTSASASSSSARRGGNNGPPPKRKKVPWTEEEVENLRRGIQNFGIGKWADIFARYKFNPSRDPTALRDKWRNLNK